MAILRIQRNYTAASEGLAQEGIMASTRSAGIESGNGSNGSVATKSEPTAWNDFWEKAWSAPFVQLDGEIDYDRLSTLVTDVSRLVYLRVWNNLKNWWRMFLLYDAKIDVTFTNNIISTPMAGGKGTIKEGINAKDHNITITGRIFSLFKNAPPLEASLLFSKCLEYQDAIYVFSPYLSVYGIHRVILEKYDMTQETNNIQKCVLKFVTDRYSEFNLTV